jgi:hypothetical protein
VFIKVVGTSFPKIFAANDWKPFQSCFSLVSQIGEDLPQNHQRLKLYERFMMTVGNHPSMTNSSIQDIWTFFLQNAEEFLKLKEILHTSIKSVKTSVFEKCMLKNIKGDCFCRLLVHICQLKNC